MPLNVHVFCFLASYLVALGLEFSRLFGWTVLNRFVMLGFGAAGFVAHTVYLLNRAHNTQLPPLLSSAHDWFLVLAWVLVLCWLVVAMAERDLPAGAFVLPVVLLLVLSTYAMAAPGQLLEEPQRVQALKTHTYRTWTMVHASSLVLGMVSVAGGLISAVMYLVKHRQLKTRAAEHKGWRMPSLERLAQSNRWTVMLAFVALTVGIVSGVILGLQQPRVPESPVRFTDPLVISGTLLWLVLTGLFAWQLMQRQLSGRQVALLTASACLLLLLTIVGLPLLIGGSGFHG